NCTYFCSSRCNSDSQESSSHPSTPVDDQPGPSSNGPLSSKRKVIRSDAMKPLWIPDDASSKCLMEGCDTVFSFLNRRHHCRDCGWLICSTCVGKRHFLNSSSKRKLFVRNVTTNWRAYRYVVVEPQTLFMPPINRRLKRMNIEQRMVPDSGLVFGKSLGQDDEPCEQYVIYGFELKETEAESGGTQFELTHRNQIMTDRKEQVISFRVEHEKSIIKWSNALRHGLGIE
ncbi:FYVE zinc finger, partial [Cooperia oncophora]